MQLSEAPPCQGAGLLHAPNLERERGWDPRPQRKRILFVDDAPMVLRGLRRMLRSQRSEWDMRFATSGKAAIEILRRESIDVLVTDVRMPGMDGTELLARVREISPQTARIVLTGHAETQALMESVLVSHRFLTKPCDPDHLTSVIQRACDLEDVLSNPGLRRVIGKVDRVPTLPSTFRRLTASLAEEEPDLDDIAAIVASDAALAAKIQQLVNSSFFGLQREVNNLREAVSFVGGTVIRHLALAFGVFDSFDQDSVPRGFSFRYEQRHSMLTAQLAKHLAGPGPDADRAFLCGLLQNIGRLVLAAEMPGDFEAVLAAATASGAPVHDTERQILGTTHAEIGGYLLGLWGLPYPVLEAVVHHHSPWSVRGRADIRLISVTHVAGALAAEALGTTGAESCPDLACLEEIGAVERLDELRALAESLLEGNAADA